MKKENMLLPMKEMIDNNISNEFKKSLYVSALFCRVQSSIWIRSDKLIFLLFSKEHHASTAHKTSTNARSISSDDITILDDLNNAEQWSLPTRLHYCLINYIYQMFAINSNLLFIRDVYTIDVYIIKHVLTSFI